jgi:hypothetical protein
MALVKSEVNPGVADGAGRYTITRHRRRLLRGGELKLTEILFIIEEAREVVTQRARLAHRFSLKPTISVSFVRR